MKLNVYIDGFNLYFGAIKGTPYKWLDLRKFCEASLPKDTIHRVRYFTARVLPRNNDFYPPLRQDVYLRAIQTLPNVTVHEGTFRERRRRVYLLASGRRGNQMADALVTEEKGSDVNLAAHLLMDGFKGDYEGAVVISDDSDLVEPILMVRKDLGLTIGILNPQDHINPNTGKRAPRRELIQAATSGFYREIDRTLLPQCLLPDHVIDANGTMLTKPAAW